MNIKQLVGKRIREAREAKKLSLNELAGKSKFVSGASGISNYERGERLPTPDIIKEFARILETDPAYLSGFTNDKPGTSPTFIRVPYCKISSEATDESDAMLAEKKPHIHEILSFNQEWIDQREINGKHLCLIEVDDQAMIPKIQCGDIVIINTKDKTISSGKIYALNYANHSIKIKMLKIDHKGNLIIHSINKHYGDELVPKKEIKSLAIVGRVVLVLSEL